MQDLVYPEGLTEKEKLLYAQSVGAIDMESESELAAQMGDYGRDAIDMDRVVVAPSTNSLAGRYIDGRGDVEFSQKAQTAGLLKTGEYYPEDSMILFGEAGLTGDTLAHETRHRSNELKDIRHDDPAHDWVYLIQAFRAHSKEDWEDVVNGFAVYLKKKGATEEHDPDKAEALLKQLLTDHQDKLFELEATEGYNKETAVPNKPSGEEGLLEAYKKQSRDLYDYRQRRINNHAD